MNPTAVGHYPIIQLSSNAGQVPIDIVDVAIQSGADRIEAIVEALQAGITTRAEMRADRTERPARSERGERSGYSRGARA